MKIELDRWKNTQNSASASSEETEVLIISDGARNSADRILPLIAERMNSQYADQKRIVIAVAGGSGAGKSAISSLLSHAMNDLGVFTVRLSGDNYPRRIPEQNDAERYRLYRVAGLQYLLSNGLYNSQVRSDLRVLQEAGSEFDPEQVKNYSWLQQYQMAGIEALKQYLGSDSEQDFNDINRVIAAFKNGDHSVWCKKMGRVDIARWYDNVQFPDCAVMIIDWTHALSTNLTGVDIQVLLASSPAETQAIRVARGRDKFADSPFVASALKLEQKSINDRADCNTMIFNRQGNLISLDQFQKDYSI